MIISPSNKVYVGSTTMSFKSRWGYYFKLSCKSQTKLYNSLKFYGPESHKFYKLWEGDVKDMLTVEAIVGTFYKVLDKNEGLNCKLPKIGDTFICISDETREKLSNMNKGKKQSEETKLKRSISNKGQIVSKEHREKISKANIGRKMTEEQIKKLIRAKTGSKLSETHKKNIGESSKKPILQFDKEGNFLKEWKSIKEASVFFNINYSGISAVCNGRQDTAAGYKWEHKQKPTEVQVKGFHK